MLNQAAKRIPWLLGGSADLAPSNNSQLTVRATSDDFEAGQYAGRNFHFGIREHAMGADLQRHVALRISAPTARRSSSSPTTCVRSIRLAALMGLPVFYIFTHDSIGVGEDGPTHQPIEHLAALRAIPNLLVIRPADANEVAEAYKVVLPLKNQPGGVDPHPAEPADARPHEIRLGRGLAARRLCLWPTAAGRLARDVILIGTGSEVSLCVDAYEKLKAEGVKARVVSMPCWELFDAQPQSYRDAVLPPSVTRRVAVELGIKQGWERYIGQTGQFIGMCGFGASAPIGVLLKHFGFTVENVVAAAKKS